MHAHRTASMHFSLLCLLCACGITLEPPPKTLIRPGEADIRAIDVERLKNFLAEFDKSPTVAMNTRPQKYDVSGNSIQQVESRFSRGDIESLRYIEIRNNLKLERFKTDDGPAPANPNDFTAQRVGRNDQVENLVDGNPLKSLQRMDSQNLRSGQVAQVVWSDSYWPVDHGLLGNRYASGRFGRLNSWNSRRRFVLSTPAESLLSENKASELSPSEKYDLLVGDSGMSLTQAMWRAGQHYADRYGAIESWMGICDGWAAAAIMNPEPVRTVNVSGGRARIPLYPSDVKGLTSLLWARATYPTHFVGTRCTVKNPQPGPTGRMSDACLDSNPATWHAGVVNMIGIERRSFIMDATYDYEVWNQPLVSYRYTYFNPETRNPTDNLQSATVRIDNFRNDRFRHWRSADTVAIVGIQMTATYVEEVSPSSSEGPSSYHRSVNYVYDLELDAAGNMVGGEWYTNYHPDFLWSIPAGTRALAAGEGNLGTWSIGGSVPDSMRGMAARASSAEQPLGGVVEQLLRAAH